MKCPNCNYENTPEAKYCKRCDEPLIDENGLWVYKDKSGIISRPCTVQELQDKYDAGVIKKNTKVREEGTSEWMPFKETDLYLPFASSPQKQTWTIYAIIGALVLFIFVGAILSSVSSRNKPDSFEDLKVTYSEAAPSLMANGWTIVEKPVYHFQSVPIPVYDKGYIVRENGKYGIIGLDGDYIVPPEYQAISIDGQVAGHTVFFEDAGNPDSGKTLEYLLNMTDENKLPEAIKIESVSITPTRNVTLPEGVSRDDFSVPVAISLKDFWYEMFNGGQKYYIWNPKNDRVFGPYSTSETAMFTLDPNIKDTYYPVPGMFYTHRNGEYYIYTDSGAKRTSQAFSFALPISDSYMLVANDRQFGVMDKNLSVTFIGSVENASAPINGTDYVEIDGNWYRIYNLALQNMQPQEEPKEDKKEEEEPKDENQYVLNHNMYIRTSPGGSVVTVASAGSTLTITNTEEVDGALYGQTQDGNWVCISAGGIQYASKLDSE